MLEPVCDEKHGVVWNIRWRIRTSLQEAVGKLLDPHLAHRRLPVMRLRASFAAELHNIKVPDEGAVAILEKVALNA